MSEHCSRCSWPWKDRKGVIGGYCYPSSCNMAKPQLSLVVLDLQLNPRRARFVHLDPAPAAQLCSMAHRPGPCHAVFCPHVSRG